MSASIRVLDLLRSAYMQIFQEPAGAPSLYNVFRSVSSIR